MSSVLAAIVWLGLGEPGATPARVVLLPLTSDASVDPGTSTTVQEQLEQGLRRGGVELVPRAEVAEVLPATCRDSACIRTLAQTLDADYVVRPRLVHDDRMYTVELELVDDTGANVVSRREQCDICGRLEVGAVAADQASLLCDRIDAEERRRMAAGSDVAPAPVVTPPRESAPPRRDPLVPAGAATLAVGVLATIGGATLLALDDRQYQRRCSGDDVDVNGTCRFSYDTLTGGAVLTAVGVAAIGSGIAMLVVGKRRGARSRTVSATFGPRGMTLHGRF